MIDRLETLAAEWLAEKAAEAIAVTARRVAEDRMLKAIGFESGTEGVHHYDVGRYAMQVQGRLGKKVDHEMVTVIAAENGHQALLPVIFRWEASINAKAWKELDPRIAFEFSKAITISPNRATFKISERE
jgi:hypothetical protein